MRVFERLCVCPELPLYKEGGAEEEGGGVYSLLSAASLALNHRTRWYMQTCMHKHACACTNAGPLLSKEGEKKSN